MGRQGRKERLMKELKRTIINLMVVLLIGGATIYWMKNHAQKAIEKKMTPQSQHVDDR